MNAVLPRRTESQQRASAGRAALASRWDALAVREKRAVLIALVVVALALLWWVLISPAVTTLKNASRQQPVLEAQLLRMKALQAEAQELQNAPKIGQTQALRALEAATKQRLGATGQLGVLGLDRFKRDVRQADPLWFDYGIPWAFPQQGHGFGSNFYVNLSLQFGKEI